MRALLIGIAHRNMIDIDSNVKALEECVGGNIEKITDKLLCDCCCAPDIRTCRS